PLNLYSSRSRAARSSAPTSRTRSPTTRAASYIDGAVARPWPRSNSRRSRVMTDCVHDSDPDARRMNVRSPGWMNEYIFWQTLTWSYPAFVRESEAVISPKRVATPGQGAAGGGPERGQA